MNDTRSLLYAPVITFHRKNTNLKKWINATTVWSSARVNYHFYVDYILIDKIYPWRLARAITRSILLSANDHPCFGFFVVSNIWMKLFRMISWELRDSQCTLNRLLSSTGRTIFLNPPIREFETKICFFSPPFSREFASMIQSVSTTA